MTQRTAYRTCPLCEAMCGLALELDGDSVTRVTGDGLDPFSGGYLCPKGAVLGRLDADPDRLSAPLVRRDGQLVPATWDEAFATIADRLPAIATAHGRDAVALYLGNPNAHNLSTAYARPLVKALGTRNVSSASSVDQLPKHVSCGWMFGDPLAIPVPDIDRTDHLLVLGGDPRVSNGSLWSAPDLPGRLDALRRRGGRLVVVDPRRSRTAGRADEHVSIRPGTDALLLAALAATLAEEDLVRLGHLAPLTAGLDELIRALSRFPAERVATTCGVPAATIRRLARELAAADRAAVYGRLGTTTVRFGTTTSWLVDVLNVLTGNLDRAGGAMFARPAHQVALDHARTFEMGRWTSRVRGLPEALGELPVATLADEILTPGEGQVRALIVVAGNPVLSTPAGSRLEAALTTLDLLVCVDPYVTATTRLADVVLPPPGPLRRAHYDLLLTHLSVRNVARYSPPVLEPEPDRPDEWEILLTLAAIALGVPVPVDVDAADELVARQLVESVLVRPGSRLAHRSADDIAALAAGRRGPERLLDLMLRAGPYGEGTEHDLSLAALEAAPHGLDLGPLTPRLPDRLATASGSIELAPPPLLADLVRLESSIERERPPLVLIGRRHLRTNNSWMHNIAALQGTTELCTLQVNPEDADRLGVLDGGSARVRSGTGEVVAPVEVTDDLRPGVVSLPHGFGHDREGVRLRVARARPGVSVNDLTDPEDLDPLSGTAVLNAIPVEISPA